MQDECRERNTAKDGVLMTNPRGNATGFELNPFYSKVYLSQTHGLLTNFFWTPLLSFTKTFPISQRKRLCYLNKTFANIPSKSELLR